MSNAWEVRQYKAEQYPMIVRWSEGHGFPPVPAVFLPKIGCVGYVDGEAVAAAWVYQDNSCPICMMEWLVSNPNAKPKDVLRGISAVIGFLGDVSREMGYHIMFSTCRQKALVRLYERNGFEKTDGEMTHFTMPLHEPKE